MNAIRRFIRHIAPLLVAGASLAQAGNLQISNEPLGTGSGASVKPNLMFILDDSSSMASDYTPDSVNDSICQTNMAAFGDTTACQFGDPPYNSGGFNRQYYNPAINYLPPKKADGSSWNNSAIDAAWIDPFTSTTVKNLSTTYTDIYWCTSRNDTAPGPNCVQNTGSTTSYRYPNATYNYRKVVDSKPYYYVMDGAPRWCSNRALTTCQARRTSTYKYPNFGATAESPAVRAALTIRITKAGGNSTSYSGSVSSILYNGTTEFAVPAVRVSNQNSRGNRNKLAADLVTAINGKNGFRAIQTVTETSNCNCAPMITVTAPAGTSAAPDSDYNGKQIVLVRSDNNLTFANSSGNAATAFTFAGGADYVAAARGVVFTKIAIDPGISSYAKHTNRTDCAGATCSYAEEALNFANWYSFYRTRMLAMKSAVSRVFSGVSDSMPGAGFRVGFNVISGGASEAAISALHSTACWTANKALELNINDFNPTHKAAFFDNLFAIKTCSFTPLRGALARAGRIYAGVHGPDPVQYSCQQNFAILSTDGYWNEYIEDASFGPIQKDAAKSPIGKQDTTNMVPPYFDIFDAGDTLADVAMYYYKEDLRPAMNDDVPVSARDSSKKQHMTTFTMGLGVDGTMIYSPDYESGGSPDYNALLQGRANWPNPKTNAGDARIDDLWHAAVNGHGKYFAASDPDEVVGSLNEALQAVSAMAGSGAAAATSNLEPVAGDNFAYVASYQTRTWDGNLEAKTIDLGTGALSEKPVWSAQAMLDVQTRTTGRTLYKFDSTLSTVDKKETLAWNALTTAEKGYFNPNQLTQCSPMSNCPGATPENLFNYLMGQSDATTNGSYRLRAHVLGDIVSSHPVYVKTPPFSYTDTGYGTFKTANSARRAMVYVGSNDGFLHAFDALSGAESWAFMPTAVLPRVHELANSNYSHRYFVDGSITVGDIDASGWKTILVGGLSAGGNTYYALDVTDPANPKALWEFSDPRMGYSYGNPIITKLQNGTWVVLVTSGYNNGTALPDHNGQGVLYVLNAATGVEISRVYTCTTQSDDSTCAGTSASPNGLAKINNWVDNGTSDNTTKYVYGGDLEGNLWRFDINATSPAAIKVAALAEPITTRPELAEISGKRMIYVGTGLFLQLLDKSDNSKRTMYGIKDCIATPCTTLSNVKSADSNFVKQELSMASGDAGARTMTARNAVDWDVKDGWYVEFLDAGERVNVDPKLQLGTLVFATNVPQNTDAVSCTTGGYSWLYYLDIATGGYILNAQSNPGNIAGRKIGNALAVGANVVKLPNGKLITITTTSDNNHPVFEAPVSSGSFGIRRVSWRELLTD